MKKILYALLALTATLSFASCNENIKEENGSEVPVLEYNTLAFKLAGAVATRSASEAPASLLGATIPVGDPVDGQQFYLEETVTNLDEVYFGGPETKGTPVYTGNFSTVSGGSFNGLAFPVATMSNKKADDAFISDGEFKDVEKFWQREFPSDPWGNYEALLFYAKMLTEATGPVDQYTTGVIPNSYRYFDSDDGVQSFTFSYRSAETAEEQQDILFAGRTITKADARGAFPILFHHALTGVKFATAHTNAATDKVKTYIKKVEFTGIYGYGKCTVTPQAETNGYVDDPAAHSSEDAISWDLTVSGASSSKTKTYYQEFPKATVSYPKGDGSFDTMGNYPSSFSAAGNENNLNNEDASMTFWLVPQTMSDDVKVKITFEIEVQVDGEATPRRTEYTRDIDFGTLLKKDGSFVTWKAGQLRTYTLKAEEVDVDIHDTVTGFEKTDVIITNTGNVDAYIRALIVANWWGYNAEETEVGIAMGYTSNAHTTYITPWERTSLSGDNYGGEFQGLPGDYWVLADDGYFYYTKPVAPGEETGYGDGETYVVNRLFDKYSMNTTSHPVPRIWYFDGAIKEYSKVFLQMEIPVQAIQANEGVDWDEAWGLATGTTPVAVAP